MQISPEQLAENYKKYHEVKLRQLLLYEYDLLGLDGKTVLVNEIRNRGLLEKYGRVIKARHELDSAIDFGPMFKKVQNSICPHCGRKELPLTAIGIHKHIGYVFGSSTSMVIIIGCPNCLHAQFRTANLKTLLFGWWTFPFGPFRTIAVFFRNYKAHKVLDKNESDAILWSIVVKNYWAFLHAEQDEKAWNLFLKAHPDSA